MKVYIYRLALGRLTLIDPAVLAESGPDFPTLETDQGTATYVGETYMSVTVGPPMKEGRMY